VLIALAQNGKETLSARELSEKMNIPYRFLEQVIRSLRQNGFIKSFRGFKGGYQLARLASDITLLEVVEAIHGPIEITPCLEEPSDCELLAVCAAHEVWTRVDEKIKRALGSVTLDKLKSKEALFASSLLN
jgi:Rrf2 family protein